MNNLSDTVDSMEVHTPPERSYHRIWRSLQDRDGFVFRAQACWDAHLALGEIPGNIYVRAYEIVIGGWGNTQTALRKNFGEFNE